MPKYNSTVKTEYVAGFSETGGNAFVLTFSRADGFEYMQLAFGPLSNDYNVWYPVIQILLRAKDPVSYTWQNWRIL